MGRRASGAGQGAGTGGRECSGAVFYVRCAVTDARADCGAAGKTATGTGAADGGRRHWWCCPACVCDGAAPDGAACAVGAGHGGGVGTGWCSGGAVQPGRADCCRPGGRRGSGVEILGSDQCVFFRLFCRSVGGAATAAGSLCVAGSGVRADWRWHQSRVGMVHPPA